jgi:hypothetical protein
MELPRGYLESHGKIFCCVAGLVYFDFYEGVLTDAG